MSPTLGQVLVVIAAHLCGSVPFGVILTRRFRGVDVRAQGSGNIGATNVARVAGKKLGLLVLALDALKGLAPVLVARALWPTEVWTPIAAGGAAILGHVFPVWLKFKGGKGVATALGVLLGLVPMAALAGAVAYVLMFAIFRVSSVGSLVGATCSLIVAFVWAGRADALFTAAVFLLLIWTHRGNLARLWKRAERAL